MELFAKTGVQESIPENEPRTENDDETNPADHDITLPDWIVCRVWSDES